MWERQPGHLDRASPGTGPEVNTTSSRTPLMHGARGPGRPGGCSTMTTIPEFLPVPGDGERWRADPLRLAVAGYLARYRGETRRHAESDLRAYLTWIIIAWLRSSSACR